MCGVSKTTEPETREDLQDVHSMRGTRGNGEINGKVSEREWIRKTFGGLFYDSRVERKVTV